MSRASILAGPLLRHVSTDRVTLWLVTDSRVELKARLCQAGQTLMDAAVPTDQHTQLRLGEHCYLQFLTLVPAAAIERDKPVEYDLWFVGDARPLADRLEGWCYDGEDSASFILKDHIDNLLHGSCRKPHFDARDGLLQADETLAKNREDPAATPALLMFTGDQVYADDVAGPMLVAIHQVMAALGLYDEHFEGARVDDTQSLLASSHCYYQREQLLPHDRASRALLERFFGGARKPIFTAAGAHNHLITFSEVVAMYLLVWSPECWRFVDMQAGLSQVPEAYRERYRKEQAILEDFAKGLAKVRRVMGHLPTYMIFDDHDVTDDWNLTRGWEEAAYGHAFSRRIIGNALIAYWLFQGWGNRPEHFDELMADSERYFPGDRLADQDALIDRLLDWEHWHYELDTEPALIVLDTRTHRWRSESSPSRPSGLMDWEALSDMQQKLIGREAVILVSPSPVFGVKLIEAVQRIFTFFGRALLVDAENWMAHPGAANVMLNIFRHGKTPPHFVILSGDVHYSFVYDITLRYRKNSPQILQVTASGLKNCFPERLLKVFDRVNQWLYGSRSPLNVFTKRRRMLIKRRQPSHDPTRVLYNQSGIGQVLLSDEFDKIETRVISRDRVVTFR